MVRSIVALVLAAALCVGIPGMENEKEPGENALLLGGNSDVFVIGEQLKYNVRYGFISLGSITVTVYDTVHTPDGTDYLARADIRSYSGVPFVNLHHIYSTQMSPIFFSNRFEGLEKSKNQWLLMRYMFEYDSMRVIIEEGAQASDIHINEVDTLSIDGYYQDGLSLFYFARGYVATDTNPTIPTLVNKDIVTTEFRFNEKHTSRKIKKVDYPVDVVEFSGKANFSGIFGMTGAFRGWFSRDTAAIPVEAKLRVLIGNITVELIEWTRPDWIPPRYTNDR
jgi:hypothetical protein